MDTAYDCIVIDMDGTIYPAAQHMSAILAAGDRLNTYALNADVPREAVNYMQSRYVRKGKVTYPTLELSRRYGLNRAKFLKYVYDIKPEDFGIKRDAELARLLEKAGRRFTLAVFTNSPNIWVRRVLSTIGIRKCFATANLVTLESFGKVNTVKPSRTAFLRMLKVLAVTPEELLFLDDNVKNIEAARNLGIKSMLISDRGSRSRGTYTIYEALRSLTNK